MKDLVVEIRLSLQSERAKIFKLCPPSAT